MRRQRAPFRLGWMLLAFGAAVASSARVVNAQNSRVSRIGCDSIVSRSDSARPLPPDSASSPHIRTVMPCLGPARDMRAGSLRDFTPQEIDALRAALRAQDWDKALRLYFGSLYDPTFVDWIVYVDSTGYVRSVLWAGDDTSGGPPWPFSAIAPNAAARARRGKLRGVSTVWVLVFADSLARKVGGTSGSPHDTNEAPRGACTPSCPCTTCPGAKGDATGKSAKAPDLSADTAPSASELVELYRRSVAYQRDPFLTAAIKALSSKIGGADVSTPTMHDTVMVMRFAQIALDAKHPFFAAMGRVQIGDNSHVEIGITPLPTYRWGQQNAERNIYGNVNNSSGSRFGFGLATGATFGASTRIVKNDTLVSGRNAWFRPNVFVFAQCNLILPDLPIDPNSFGVAVGTNILRDDPLSDLLLTASIRFLRPVELLIGTDFLTSDDVRVRATAPAGEALKQHVTGRAGRPFLGVAFQF